MEDERLLLFHATTCADYVDDLRDASDTQ